MNKSSISTQLQHDYPDYKIYLDADSRMIVADDHKMSLLNTPSVLHSMNIFSRSGKSFYQAIAQLLYSNYNIRPLKGSYADTLIILKEDLNKFKVQKLAREWGIGFLESDEDIVAVGVDDGIERTLLLEGDEVTEELFEDDESLEFPDSIEQDDSSFGVLEELDFEDEIAYLEKGVEFVTEMENIKTAAKEVRKEFGDGVGIDKKIIKNVQKSIDKGIFSSLRRIFKRFED
jgi:hypothetical protein